MAANRNPARRLGRKRGSLLLKICFLALCLTFGVSLLQGLPPGDASADHIALSPAELELLLQPKRDSQPLQPDAFALLAALPQRLASLKPIPPPPPKEEEAAKIAYLTFDDGPSKGTAQILDTLRDWKVPATFFVIANQHDYAKPLYQRILQEGHALGLHTFSHQYAEIYASREAYIADLDAVGALVKELTGYESKIWRFAGGSAGYRTRGETMFRDIVLHYHRLGYEYFDWNVSGEDAVRPRKTSRQIADLVLETSKNKQHVQILLHDGGGSHATPDALPLIIQGLRDMGFVFRVLTPETPAMHQFKG